MSSEELFLSGITPENLINGAPLVQEFFHSILRKAESEADFLLEDGSIMIEAMPLQNDDIAFILTRPQTQELTDKKGKRPRPRIKTVRKPKRTFLYRFDSFEDVCAFSKEWRCMGEKSSLYHLEESYYLSLSFDGIPFDKAYTEAQILEFAYPEKNITESYLSEHGKIICDGDAIASLLRYF